MNEFICIFVSWTCILGLAGSPPPSATQAALTAPVTDSEIELRIRELSDPSYAKRTLATQRLCAIGMAAHDQLQAAADGPDAEAALRAKAILGVMERLWFTGVDVRLELSASKIKWSEPVDLILEMTNNSKYPARIPFEDTPGEGTEALKDARQVGSLLDLSEVVHVRREDGREIELKIDDIGADPGINDAVQRRLDGGPVRVIDPGRTLTVKAPAFNRGWARYRLLDAGKYTMQLEYVPRWDDEALASARIGRVASNEVTLIVTDGAPKDVSRIGVEASMALKRENGQLVATLTNRSDQSVTINRNFGSAPPFADARWVYELGTIRRDLAVQSRPGASWDDFDPSLLASVEPGETIELARINLKELQQSLARLGAATEGPGWTIHFTYLNAFNRQWQQNQQPNIADGRDLPRIFNAELPKRILSTRHNTNQLTAPDIEPVKEVKQKGEPPLQR